MPTTWKFQVDWERTGEFTGTYDDISNRVMDANWFLGMRSPYQDVADNSTLHLTLRNDDRYFSQEHSGSAISDWLEPYRTIRVVSDDGTTERVHWIGWIEIIKPKVNQNGERTATITANGPMYFLKFTETDHPISESIRADEVMQNLLTLAVKPPAITNVWLLGRGQLGVGMILGSYTDIMELEEGKVTLTMVGDNWVHRGASSDERDTFHIYRAISDLTIAERGRFFFRRDGKAVFWNRDHLFIDKASSAAFNDTMQGLEYAYAGLSDFKNEIIVACHPRSISATSDETLWELKSSITVPANGSRKLRAKFDDDSGGRVGGRDTSLTYSFSSGSGNVSMDDNANSAVLTINNTGSTDAVLSSCVIKGQKILDLGRMEAIATDEDSIATYGRRTMIINAAALSELDVADAIATYELERRKDPRGTVQSILLRSHPEQGGQHHANQLALTIGDRITIQETQADHSDDYYIMGETHRIQGGLLETTWYLEPVSLTWLAGYGSWYQDSVAALQDSAAKTALAQQFSIPHSDNVASVDLWLKKVGSPTGNLTAKLYTDSSDEPDTLLATSAIVGSSTLASDFGWVTFSFSPTVSLTGSTKYWVVLSTSDSSDASNYVVWGTDSSSPTYTDGEMKSEQSSAWSAESMDACFVVNAA